MEAPEHIKFEHIENKFVEATTNTSEGPVFSYLDSGAMSFTYIKTPSFNHGRPKLI